MLAGAIVLAILGLTLLFPGFTLLVAKKATGRLISLYLIAVLGLALLLITGHLFASYWLLEVAVVNVLVGFTAIILLGRYQ